MSKQDIDKNVEHVWNDFWKEIVCNPDGSINVEQVKKELADFKFIIDQVPEVYSHITGGQLSKHMYYARSVIAESDNYTQKLIDQAIEDYKEEQAERKGPQ